MNDPESTQGRARTTEQIATAGAGTEGSVSLEDTLLAGALVDYLCQLGEVRVNDGARVAWDCFENQGRVLLGALEVSQGGAILRRLGYDEDIRSAAQVDRFALVPAFAQAAPAPDRARRHLATSSWAKCLRVNFVPVYTRVATSFSFKRVSQPNADDSRAARDGSFAPRQWAG